jgi:hypothetical protein
MISNKKINEYFKRIKTKELKKYQSISSSIRFGKPLYRNCFDYNIDISNFEKVLNKYIAEYDQSQFISNQYCYYFDGDRKLVIHKDGYGKLYSYSYLKEYPIQIKGKYEGRFIFKIKNKHNVSTFPLKYDYDNITQVDELLLKICDNISILFKRLCDKDKNRTYDISIDFVEGCDYELLEKEIKKLGEGLN